MNEQNYINYLKTSDQPEVLNLVSSFENKELTFPQIVESISPVKQGVMSYWTFCKSQRLDHLLD